MIDLHTHSTCSDGSEQPARVIQLAVSAGCRAVALTDHDTLDGIGEARSEAARSGIELLVGCEVSATRGELPLHLLCYFFSEPGDRFAELLALVRADRESRNVAIAERLAALGLSDALAGATAKAGGKVVGRPHFAALLVEKRMAKSFDDAFERYLKRGAAAYVPRGAIAPAEVIATAGASGGVVAFAHPLSCELPEKELDRLVGDLAGQGLAGLESHYAAYDAGRRARLVALARRHRVVPTGGSDFHGRHRPESRVGVGAGDLHVPDSVLDELAEKAPR